MQLEMLEGRRLMAASYEIVDLGEVGSTTGGESNINNKGHIVVADDGRRELFKNGRKLRDLAVRDPGSDASDRVGINDKGWVAGTVEDGNDEVIPVIWNSKGKMIKLKKFLGDGKYVSQDAYDINNDGVVVGQVTSNTDFLSKALRWGSSSAKPKNVLKLGFQNNPVYAINEDGDIVGASIGVINGKFKVIGNFMGEDINNKELAVGFSAGLRGSTASYSQSGKEPKDLRAAGEGASAALGVNKSGVIVGYGENSDSDDDAYIWSSTKAKPQRLDKLLGNRKWDLERAQAINDKGQIVGIGTFKGQRHFFLMNPVKSEKGATEAAVQTQAPTYVVAPAQHRKDLFASGESIRHNDASDLGADAGNEDYVVSLG